MKASHLPDRGVVKVAGATASAFLQGLLTADIDKVRPGEPRFAALLTPQGKIIIDGLVIAAPATDGEGFLLDCPRVIAAGLVARLEFYKLRTRVTIEDQSERLAVLAAWDGAGHGSRGGDGLVYPDPRLAALGVRAIMPLDRIGAMTAALGADLVEPDRYEAHRIALGVPRGGTDFAYGEAFPHETDMDQLGGIDFAKGCYVGQEVVSRMQHRGTARTRVIPVACDGPPPDPGTPVTADQKTVGTFGSSAGNRALAMLRLDRVADACAAGLPLVSGRATLRPVKPDWARFEWPGEKTAAGPAVAEPEVS